MTTSIETSTMYSTLARLGRERATLGSVLALIGWDQETYMPDAAAAGRAEQAAMLSGMVHERLISDAFADALAACEADPEISPGSPESAAVREFRRDHDRARKIPTDLVSELARTGSRAQETWKKARETNDFAMFAPVLEKVIGLTLEKARHLGTPVGGELYDALLEEYEPAGRASEIDAIFKPLGARLSDLIKTMNTNGTPPDQGPLSPRIPEANQHTFGTFVLTQIGFEFDRGRLDTTTHPFCSGLAPGDTRLTTRYRDERFTDALYGSMHEAGHGMYEQGLPKDGPFGSPLSEAISLGIHESQSRLWENLVGRSREFWTWAMPHAKQMLPGLEAYSVDEMFRAVNTASPSYVRVEADEATYNLHVMLRFEIERAIASGDLPVKEIPGYWNARFKELLGLEVPDDRRGCLQDVHWSFGLFGYFPTYTLGNLYASQFWETMHREMPLMIDRMAEGDFSGIKTWLNEKIHAHGRRYRAGELCEMLTGEALSPEPLMRHLETRLRESYGI